MCTVWSTVLQYQGLVEIMETNGNGNGNRKWKREREVGTGKCIVLCNEDNCSPKCKV